MWDQLNGFLESTYTEKSWSKILFPGVSTGGATRAPSRGLDWRGSVGYITNILYIV